MNLTAKFDQITLPEAPSKQPPRLTLVAPTTPVTSKLNNDKVGVCPHCSGKMVLSKLNIARLNDQMSVYVCPKDRYVAPLPSTPAVS